MERNGYVSLWIGTALSDELLEEYLELGYDEDGNSVPSMFLKDFEIDEVEFDEDFAERIFYEEQVEQLGDLLEGCSYDEIVLPQFREKISEQLDGGVNAAILLYHFEYTGKVEVCEREGCRFRFMGAVKYEE